MRLQFQFQFPFNFYLYGLPLPLPLPSLGNLNPAIVFIVIEFEFYLLFDLNEQQLKWWWLSWSYFWDIYLIKTTKSRKARNEKIIFIFQFLLLFLFISLSLSLSHVNCNKMSKKKIGKNMSHGKDQQHLFKFDVAIMRQAKKQKKFLILLYLFCYYEYTKCNGIIFLRAK